jgi:uncharacterized membrane protein
LDILEETADRIMRRLPIAAWLFEWRDQILSISLRSSAWASSASAYAASA